jgi:hypothetical protein
MGEAAIICVFFAAMAELVDALDSGSSRGNPVDVRVILAAHSYIIFFLTIFPPGSLWFLLKLRGNHV